MKKKLIIFDLDGTLINTLKDLNEAVNYALSKYQYPLRTIDNTRNDIGNGVAKLIERSIPNGLTNPKYEECLSIFKKYYKEHYIDNSLPYDGISDLLNDLKDKYLLAVVSNKFDEGAKKLVTHYFPNTFIRIQGQVPYLRTKPSSDLVNKVLDELNLSNQDAIYVGDTEIDYFTAQNSGILPILVTYGYRTIDQLKERTNCSFYLNHPKDFLSLL